MKLRHKHSILTNRSIKAFTLIELLVVIAIIALIAALSMGVYSGVMQTRSRETTKATAKAIELALSRYNQEIGGYPTPANPGKTGAIGNTTALIGGALMLYQAVTGDGNDQIKLEGNRAQRSSDGIVERDEQKYTFNPDFVPVKDANGYYRSKTGATIVTADGYLIVDGFGHPFFYTSGDNENAVNTSTYDLWSVAQSSLGESFSKTEKQDSKRTEAWIKNW